MNKYDKVILTYWDEDGEKGTLKLKNATFLFDNTFTTIFTKKDSFTIKSSAVISIEAIGVQEEK